MVRLLHVAALLPLADALSLTEHAPAAKRVAIIGMLTSRIIARDLELTYYRRWSWWLISSLPPLPIRRRIIHINEHHRLRAQLIHWRPHHHRQRMEQPKLPR